MKKAVQKIKELQSVAYQDDLILQGLPKPQEEIPEVHPGIVIVDLYNEYNFPKDDTYKPSSEKVDQYRFGKEVLFCDLLQLIEKHKFITLSAFPGVGKTTLAKRLARAVNQRPDGLCFYLEFVHMSYPEDHKLTVRELLLDNAYPDLDTQIYQNAYEWVLKNQEKCLIVLDGYDKSEWAMNDKPANQNDKTPQNIRTLVANICRNHILRQVPVVLTSRPHCIFALPPELRLSFRLMLQDLSFENAKILFFSIAQDSAVQFWKTLLDTASHLIGFCLNPLILQLYIRACFSTKNNVNEITTVTQIYTTVLADIKDYESTQHSNLDEITEPLSKLAFKAIQNWRVAITVEELKEAKLSLEKVQDLVSALHDFKRSKKVLGANTKLYFLHQTLLEYFAAQYVSLQMDLSEYKIFLKESLFKHQWSMVRRFLCGILLDVEGFPRSLGFLIRRLVGSLTQEGTAPGA